MSIQGLGLLANARMYAVSEVARTAWQSVFEWLSDRSGVPLTVIDYPPPSPLADLWRRPNLGCVLMCGWPFTCARPRPRLLAAPVPLPERYGDEAVYFSDLVVHRDSSFQTLEDTFQGIVGWTLIVAAQRADDMLERGDHDGKSVWLRIRRAVVEMQAAPMGKPN